MDWQFDWTTLGPGLVIRGTLLGSLLVAFGGFLLTGDLVLPAHPEALLPPLQSVLSITDSHTTNSHTTADEIPNTRDTQPQPQPVCGLSSKFPNSILKWCDEITRMAEKYHVPPDLIASIIWIESGGNPSAYSHSGAVGLMQVMPRDGLAGQFQCANGPCFANRPTMEQLQDPLFNIQYGTRMLAGLIKRHGSLRDALRAYGPMDAGYSYADKVLAIYRKYGKDEP